MSSGYFPLNKKEPTGKRLLEVIDALESIRSEMTDAVHEGPFTPEDAASDGAFLEKLWMAKSFLEECLEQERIDDKEIAGRKIKEWKQLARQDDCFDQMVPSDLRQLISALQQ